MDTFNFKHRDAASYDLVTEDFNRFSQRQTEPLARKLIRTSRIERGQAVLDVGTGTGIIALLVASESGGNVTGIDLSEGMLSAAEALAKREGLDSAVRFRRMDAEALDLPNSSFDVVISLFALFHFPNPERALSEMGRVLRPGGRLLVGVGTSPRYFSWAGLRRGAARVANRIRFGSRRLVAPGCLEEFINHYLPSSHEEEVTDWSRGRGVHGTLRKMFRNAGFVKIRESWFGCETLYESAKEFWEVQATFSSTARKRLAAAPAEVVDRIREAFLEKCKHVQISGGRFVYPSGAFCVSGLKPLQYGAGRISHA